MDEDKLNTQVRKFLKKVGVTSQREIEKAIRQALEDNRIQGNEDLEVSMTLQIPALELYQRIDGDLELEDS